MPFCRPAKYCPDIMRKGIPTFSEVRASFEDLYRRNAPLYVRGAKLATIPEGREPTDAALK